MAGRQPVSQNTPSLNDLHYGSFTIAADGKPSIVVTNADGSSIGSAGSSGNVNINQVGGAAFALGQTGAVNSLPVVIASNQTAVPTTITANALSTSPLVGQAKIVTTNTAINLNGGISQLLANGIIITAPSINVAPVAIGGVGVTNTGAGAGNGYLLTAGASISFAVTNTNTIYINGSANDFISWAAS